MTSNRATKNAVREMAKRTALSLTYMQTKRLIENNELTDYTDWPFMMNDEFTAQFDANYDLFMDAINGDVEELARYGEIVQTANADALASAKNNGTTSAKIEEFTMNTALADIAERVNATEGDSLRRLALALWVYTMSGEYVDVTIDSDTLAVATPKSTEKRALVGRLVDAFATFSTAQIVFTLLWSLRAPVEYEGDWIGVGSTSREYELRNDGYISAHQGGSSVLFLIDAANVPLD